MKVVTSLRSPSQFSVKVFDGQSAVDVEQSLRALRQWIAADRLEVLEDRPDEGWLEVRMLCGCCVMRVEVT